MDGLSISLSGPVLSKEGFVPVNPRGVRLWGFVIDVNFIPAPAVDHNVDTIAVETNVWVSSLRRLFR